jgi:hypothetical protein
MTQLMYCPSSSVEDLDNHELPQSGYVGFSRVSNLASPECKL